MATASPSKQAYENNPFFVAANGITLLFDLARGVAILLVIISIFSLFVGGPSPDTTTNEQHVQQFTQTISSFTPSEWLVTLGAVFIVVLAIALVSALFGGVSAYTSAQTARGNRVSLGDAFRTSFDHLWSYLWLQIIMFVKLFLWTLLFIVPAIIMSVKYSLAGVAFYDEKKNLRGNAAIQESIRMTRGAWITTYASSTLLNLLTLGVIARLTTVGTNAILYKQYETVGDKKPKAHWLSWVTLALPLAIMLLLILFVVFLAVVIGVTELLAL